MLRFRARWDIEDGYDFADVQVSTDGGATYTDLGRYTGDSGGWRDEIVDLSAYAGRDVVIALRYRTDELVDLPGVSIDDVALGGTAVSDGSDLGRLGPTSGQIRPQPVEAWTLQLVGYTDDHRRAWIMLASGTRELTLGRAELRDALGHAHTVGAIVTAHGRRGVRAPVSPALPPRGRRRGTGPAARPRRAHSESCAASSRSCAAR